MATLQIKAFAQALSKYEEDVGRYPDVKVGLNALVHGDGTPRWHGPYLDADVPTDPWGLPYQYRVEGVNAAPEVISYGADRRPGGIGEAADISSKTLSDKTH